MRYLIWLAQQIAQHNIYLWRLFEKWSHSLRPHQCTNKWDNGINFSLACHILIFHFSLRHNKQYSFVKNSLCRSQQCNCIVVQKVNNVYIWVAPTHHHHTRQFTKIKMCSDNIAILPQPRISADVFLSYCIR